MEKGTGSRVVESGIHVEGGGTDEWATPPHFLRPIMEAVDGFDLDPAAGAESSPIAEETFALERGEDGLSEPWHGRVWCNPPYSEKDEWTEKAWKESTREAVEFVALLLSVDTSSDRFHKFVPRASYVYLHDSRLKFGDSDDSAPFCTVLYLFGGGVPDDLLGHLLKRSGMLLNSEAIVEETRQVALDSFG